MYKRQTYYNPYKNPENALKRRDKILDDMMECGFISREEYEEAVAEKIVVTRPPTEFKNYQTTYAIDCAVRYLMAVSYTHLREKGCLERGRRE